MREVADWLESPPTTSALWTFVQNVGSGSGALRTVFVHLLLHSMVTKFDGESLVFDYAVSYVHLGSQEDVSDEITALQTK
jgi:hypothetical protein